MKRRILLFMMTALLSVGAWAQSLQTKTLFEGSKTVTSSDPLTIAKSELQGARIGSQICIYLSLSGEATWGYNINYYGDGWKATWSNKGDNIVVSQFVDEQILSYDNPLKIYAQDNESTTPTCTVKKVTLNYNGANLLSSESGISPHIWGDAVQLKKGLFAYATEGDVLSVNVSAISNDGWKKMFLTSGQGNPEDMDDAVDVYNDTPSETEIELSASSFTDIVVGSYIHFTTTTGGIEAKSSGTALASNLYWNEISFYVTDENISTIKDNGITVTVTTTESNTLTVTKQNPRAGTPTGYWRTGDLTVGEKVNIPLTSALLGHAQEGEGDGNLYLSGYSYSTTSVDLIYAPIMLANDADNTTTISDWKNILTNVTLAGRTLTKSGDWNTLCLPFALTSSQIAASPLAGATIKELNTSSSSLASDGTLTLNFTTATEIEAGKPYIVKWASGENVSNPLFEGVTITATTPTAVEFTNNAGGDNCKFVGQFSPFTIDAGNKDEIIMLGSGSQLGYSQNDRTLKTFRAHFEVPTTSGGAAARAFVMNFGDEETTGIISVQGSGSMVNGSDAWYSLGGQRLQSAPTAKGVYIQNGRKVVVK